MTNIALEVTVDQGFISGNGIYTEKYCSLKAHKKCSWETASGALYYGIEFLQGVKYKNKIFI